MALLVRRVRERLQPETLLCIGTSATMANEGSLADMSRVVAGVISKLLGSRVAESNVIAETLEPTTAPHRHRRLRAVLAGRGRRCRRIAGRLRRRSPIRTIVAAASALNVSLDFLAGLIDQPAPTRDILYTLKEKQAYILLDPGLDARRRRPMRRPLAVPWPWPRPQRSDTERGQAEARL